MAKMILVVDDEPEMRALLSTVLEDNGYVTMTASDGDEARDQIKLHKPDLVCLDLLMPKTTGLKLFEELRTDPETSDIPVLMVTGLTQEDNCRMDFRKVIEQRRLRPPEACLDKPVDVRILLDALREAIEETQEAEGAPTRPCTENSTQLKECGMESPMGAVMSTR